MKQTATISLIIGLASLTTTATLADDNNTTYHVVEYHPAPGQFVNILPQYEQGDTHDAMCRHCEEQLADGNPVTLGAFGGYITFGFDTPIANLQGSDLRIAGNAYYAANDPLYGATTIGGSIEPGTVWAGVGENVETAVWYELAGSEYYTTEQHNTTIAYTRPESETGQHSLPYSTFDNYIPFHASWTDSNAAPHDSTGFFMKNTFHNQTYWPQWESGGKLTFNASRLPNNAINHGGDGTDAANPQLWITYRYAADAYGYADAAPTSEDRYNTFDLSWAVDAGGNPINIDHADFIRIQTALLQQCGWTGETSTEVCSIENLHLRPGYDADPIIITPRPRPTAITTPNTHNNTATARYRTDGTRLNKPQRGLNIIRYADGSVRKVMVK